MGALFAYVGLDSTSASAAVEACSPTAKVRAPQQTDQGNRGVVIGAWAYWRIAHTQLLIDLIIVLT